MLLFAILVLLPSVLGICNFIVQKPGQYCADLAKACKIDIKKFYSYNPGVGSDCSKLVAGQKVCCNAGGISPTPNPDGSCANYKVKSGDYCNAIAANFGITTDQLLQYNKQTWGWLGCENLQLDMNICVSAGTPPRPTPNPASMCGKTAPGDLYDKPCPLNACCSQWGYCGMSPEFCTNTLSSTNNPGTVGCQSNCGMEYKANTGPPASFIKLGYFETWNKGRSCMTMDMVELQALINKEKYTHMHYAFGIIKDYVPYVEDMEMWNQFLQLKNVKKIISFGGWAFSTEDKTRPIFGDSVLTDRFVTNLVNMAKQYNLDGVDIDWEYPGATDLKGWAGSTPTVHPNDGANYLNFIRKLRAAMPAGITVSICAPASYWYLKNFPIAEMNAYLDYIVFMTYDLHGQWDINIPSLGPKLLSHVSKPETINALTMITKAGMSSNKILMGVASYGRAFWQSDPNCDGPTCTFTSKGATPGRCTKESSYLGYGEIQEIINSGQYRKLYYDSASDSDILLYGTNDWVAYTNISTTMNSRYQMARSMNLGGTVEWAVDLRMGTGSTQVKGAIVNYSFDLQILPCPNNIKTIDEAMNLDGHCIHYGLTQALWHISQDSINSYNAMITGNYTTLYSKKYLPYAIDNAYKEHIIFWNSATIENNAVSSAFDKHINCYDDCTSNGSVTLKQDLATITKAFMDFMGSGYAMNSGTFKYPESFGHDKLIEFTQFPVIDIPNSFIDPSTEISGAVDPINKLSAMLTDAINNPANYEHEEVVDATMYNVITIANAVDGMKQVIDVGNKIVEQEQKAAANFILNIIMALVEIIVAFIPVVGPALSTVIGITYSIATGDTDPLSYIFAAAGAIGDLADLYKLGKNFGEIATISRGLRKGDNLKSLKHLDLKDVRIKKINDIKLKANVCKR